MVVFFNFIIMKNFYENDKGIELDPFTLVNLKDELFASHVDISVNKRNFEGWTLLMYACNRGQKSVVEYLIAHGAEINSLGPKTPLMLAIGNGNFEIVKLVYCFGGLEIRDNRGWTALFYAVFFGREICVKFLLRQGANVNLEDIFGQTPVHIAINSGMENIAAILLAAGKTPETKPPTRQSLKTKTSIFKPIRTFSPNARPCVSPKMEKENITPIKNFLPSATKLGILASPKPKGTPKKEKPTISVLTFLAELGLEKYWPTFRDEEIDFETLLTFNEQNLIDIGIKLYGPRKKITAAIEEYRTVHGGNSRLLKNSQWTKD